MNSYLTRGKEVLSSTIKLIDIKIVFIITGLFLGSLVVVFQTNPLMNNPGNDGGFYLYAGNELLHSKKLYIDLWDHKPPLIFYINAFGIWIGQGTQWGIFLLEFMTIFFSSLLLFFSYQKRFRLISIIPAGMIGFLILKRFLGGGNYTEEYSLIFNSMAIFLFFRISKRFKTRNLFFLLGILAGLGFMIRANNIGPILALCVASGIESIWSKRFKEFLEKVGFTFIGFLTSFLLVSLPLMINGSFFEMINAAFFYNYLYSDKDGLSISAIANFLENNPHLLFLLGLGLFSIGIRITKKLKEGKFLVFEVFLVFLILFELVMTNLSGRGFGHYYISFFIVVISILGHLIEQILRKFKIKQNEKLNIRDYFRIILLGVFFLIMFFPNEISGYYQIGNRLLFNRNEGVRKEYPIADFLLNNTEDREPVIIWGAKQGIYFLSKTTPVSKFINYPFYVESEISRLFETQFISDLKTAQPKFIVDMYSHAPDQMLSLDVQTREIQLRKEKNDYYMPEQIGVVFDYISSNYELIDIIDGCGIYQWIDQPDS